MYIFLKVYVWKSGITHMCLKLLLNKFFFFKKQQKQTNSNMQLNQTAEVDSCTQRHLC